MAGIGHVFWAVCILIPVMYYSRDKFNYKVAFIFVSANHFAGQDFYGTPFHSLIGIFAFSAFMALFYSYFSRFSLEKSERFFPLKLVDTGIRDVSFKNAYLLGVSGGILHIFVDGNFHLEKEFHIWPGFDLTEEMVLSWGGAYHVVDPLMAIGYVLLPASILILLYGFKKGYKDTLIMMLAFVGITLAFILALGGETMGGEREIAIILYALLFVLIPLFLLLYVARDVEDKPNRTPDVPRFSRKFLLNLTIVLSFVVVVVLFGLAIIGFFSPEILSVPIAQLVGVETEVITSIVLIEAIFALIGAILLIIGIIGLILRKNLGRYLVIMVYTGLFIFGFPFVFALFLCEKEVKEMFVTIQNDSVVKI